MPESSPSAPDSEERKERALAIARAEGLVLVPPYDDPDVAAGQGTAGLELLEDAGPFDRFYCPVSGGGLIAGCATAFSALSDTEVVGVEPESGDYTRRSLAARKRVSVPPPETIADGLRVRIPGEQTWPVVKRLVRRIETVTDDEIREAMVFALHNLSTGPGAIGSGLASRRIARRRRAIRRSLERRERRAGVTLGGDSGRGAPMMRGIRCTSSKAF